MDKNVVKSTKPMEGNNTLSLKRYYDVLTAIFGERYGAELTYTLVFQNNSDQECENICNNNLYDKNTEC